MFAQGLSMGSIRGSVLEFLSGGEGADPGAADAAQASQQRAFVRGLLPGIGHRGPVPAAAEPSTAAAAAAAAAAAPAAPPPLAASPPAGAPITAACRLCFTKRLKRLAQCLQKECS